MIGAHVRVLVLEVVPWAEVARGLMSGPQAPPAGFAPRILAVVVPPAPLEVVHRSGSDGVCSADTRCLLLGLCNFVGPECQYMFPESTASAQEVGVSLFLPLVWEGGPEPGGCSNELVWLSFLSQLRHLLWCHRLVLAVFRSWVAKSDTSYPKNRCAGLDPSPSVGVFLQSRRA